MSADNVLGLEIVLKISHLPSKLRFSAKCSFFGQSLSRGHYQPTYQALERVYLLSKQPRGVCAELAITNLICNKRELNSCLIKFYQIVDVSKL